MDSKEQEIISIWEFWDEGWGIGKMSGEIALVRLHP
jgi:hypothetical protein